MHYFHIKTTDAFGEVDEFLATSDTQHGIYEYHGVKPSSEIKQLTALEYEQQENEWTRIAHERDAKTKQFFGIICAVIFIAITIAIWA